MFSMFLLISGALLILIIYYYAYPLWIHIGLGGRLSDSLMYELYASGVMRSQGAVRSVCIFFCTVSVIVRSGNPRNSTLIEILFPLLTGLSLFFSAIAFKGVLMVICTVAGYLLYFSGVVLLGRKYRSFNPNLIIDICLQIRVLL